MRIRAPIHWRTIMYVSEMSARSSSVLSLLRELGRPPSAQPASGDANDLIKTAQGLSPAPGPAARQASGAAVIFNVTQAERDAAAQRAKEPRSIIIAIGQSQVAERFDNWGAVEDRIRSDRTMTDKEKNLQLAAIKDEPENDRYRSEFAQSDFYIALLSGEFKRAMDAAVETDRANDMAEAAEFFKTYISGPPVLSLSRNADA
ncbi:hypothetical protein CRT23_17295 [Methylobacterium sp. V23]|nr:hypothetical protein CRT23_17295 [Methylobacterium sp. V23]